MILNEKKGCFSVRRSTKNWPEPNAAGSTGLIL